MGEKKKNPTWFFIVIIGGAVILLFALFSGIVPETEEEPATDQTTTIDFEETTEPDEQQEEPAGGGTIDPTSLITPLGLDFAGETIVDQSEHEGILTVQFEDGAVTRATEDFEGIIRHSITAQDDKTVTVGGVEGVLVTGFSAKDGSPLMEILVTKDGFIYEFKGDEGFLQRAQDNVTFTEL